eukprot:sb/3475407/
MAKRLKLSFSIDQILGLSLDKSSGEARDPHQAASQVMAMITNAAGAGSMISSAGSMISSAGSTLGGTEEHTAEYRHHSSPGSDGLNDYHSDEGKKGWWVSRGCEGDTGGKKVQSWDAGGRGAKGVRG